MFQREAMLELKPCLYELHGTLTALLHFNDEENTTQEIKRSGIMKNSIKKAHEGFP